MKSKNFELFNWNEIGRSISNRNSQQIGDYHEGRVDEPSLVEDPRTPEMAEAVLAEVVRLNAEGRAAEARSLFDPAHAPFVPALEKGGRGLGFCAILGPDEFIVNQGTLYSNRTTWHIKGDRIAQAETLAAFAWSRTRKHFVTVRPDGVISTHDSYGAKPNDVIPALPGSAFLPADLPRELDNKMDTPGDDAEYTHLAISDDGRKILLCDCKRGIALLRKTSTGWMVQLLYPSTALGLKERLLSHGDDDGDFWIDLDMLHGAMSPDGCYAALGTQDDGHFLVDLDAPGAPSLHAKLGYLSEYPHDACFSSDSRFAAFNSCHFYNGITFVSDIAAVQGLSTEPYDRHPEQHVVNSYLRVYASGYLPASMANDNNGAFLLAGSSFATCVTPSGKVLWELGFGSSAAGVDVCPETGRVLIASYSGILHLLDPSRVQDPPIFPGYRAPQELRRWLFWDRLEQPLIW